ncbi:MAG: TIGR03936 family radical SAM-associated protein [Clostridiales bacterium]|jgi:radical SAM-linked protein|nr:TIGR03936 family radical SAM-associated protein [Clostridiales bacterium]
MLLVRYSRLASAAYIPHLDLMRAFQRTIRRAGLPIGMSEGFNPHMRLFFAAPIPVGLETLCEYVTVDSATAPAVFLERFNAVSVPGIRAVAATATATDPNVARLCNACEYAFTFAAPADAAAVAALKAAPLILTHRAKERGMVTEDMSERLYAVTAEGARVTALVSFGQSNLRADVLAARLSEVLGQPCTGTIKLMLYHRVPDGALKAIEQLVGGA